MTYVAILSGSPSIESRTGYLLDQAEEILLSQGFPSRRIDIRSLPADALVRGDGLNTAIEEAVDVVGQASAVVIATPVYNASYSGLLKTFLDLLPRTVFAGKPVLSLAVGGSQGYMLTLDYALRPVLSALGAWYQLSGVFASHSDIPKVDGDYELSPPVAGRLFDAVSILTSVLNDSAAVAAERLMNRAVNPARPPDEMVVQH